MEEQILHFTEQFAWKPELLRAERLPENPSHFIVCGMGGSHLGARVLQRIDPSLPLSIHSDYGLPRESLEHLRTALIVASSYSGDTEEVLDSALLAVEAGLAVAIITTGGALAQFAEDHVLPLILIPKGGVEPRMAIGAEMLALTHLMRQTVLEEDLRRVGISLDVNRGREEGEALAKSLTGLIPLVYSSTLNASLAYFWKIALNETSKVPAFYNLFPEVCHNELSGFDNTERASAISKLLHVIIIKDYEDHPHIDKRMSIMQDLLQKRGVTVSIVESTGATSSEKVLQSILTGVWTAVMLARYYHAPDAATPLIAEFKHKMIEP